MLDDAERRALLALGEDDIWGNRDLPPGVDADILRGLDAEGLVEVRHVLVKNMAKYAGDVTTQPGLCHGQWLSPIRTPRAVGGWDAVLKAPPRDDPRCIEPPQRTEWVHEPAAPPFQDYLPGRHRPVVHQTPAQPSFEIRLTEKGWGVRARLRRGQSTEAVVTHEAAREGATERQERLRVMAERLNSTEVLIIRAMADRGFTSVDVRGLPSQEKVGGFIGLSVAETTLKVTLASLVKSGLLDNGRHHRKRGGYFLTGDGVDVARALSSLS